MRRLGLLFVMFMALSTAAFATPITSFCASGSSVTSEVETACVGQFDGNTPTEWDGLPELFRWNDGDLTSTSLFEVVTSGTGGTFQYLGTTPLAFFAIKYGGGESFFEMWDVIPNTPGPVSFTWVSPLWQNQVGRSIIAGTSHVSLYDTAQPVPEPGSMSLLGIGLLACGRALRKGWAIQK